MAEYDSRPETHEHIAVVRGLMLGVAHDLLERAHRHDVSKLEEPEREMFDRFTARLRETTYGSEEYERCREEMGEALRHHYRMNAHHPEHWAEGVADMGLVDLLEMLCDWVAATRRHADGDIQRSIEQNAERFGYGPELAGLLHNSVQGIFDAEVSAHG
jgi:hypothetical protein